jgi:hypothetical protein
MNAYDVMHEWDHATGRAPRTEEELDKAISAELSNEDYEDWKARLEAKDIKAIITGMKIWGLPIGPLGPFEMDAGIETAEREMYPKEG